ncbi:MAG: hypothetical protein E7614_04945 [Ruminococcaceae bacterium]|nr:hypothetical protein [Oscillospiraceae bacterium]
MSPIKHCKDKAFHIQSNIFIALVPIIIWGVYVFGTRALLLLATSTVFSIVTELSILAVSKNLKSFSIFRPVITGILTGLIFPVSTPLWAIALAGFIASSISLIRFRGTLSCTLANPVASAGIILYGLFSAAVNCNTAPFNTFSFSQLSTPNAERVMTVLESIKNGTDSITNSTLLNAFLGRDSGAIGEISAFLIILCGIFLIIKNYTSFHIPVAFISTVFLISFFLPVGNCEAIYSASVETLSGGVLFSAFFVATMTCSSPITKNGKLFFGILCGIITVFIRRFTSIADGTLIAVGIASVFSQIIDNLTGNKYFSFMNDRKSESIPQKTNLEALLKDGE